MKIKENPQPGKFFLQNKYLIKNLNPKGLLNNRVIIT